MKSIKRLLIEKSLNQIEQISIKIAESSESKCHGFGFYETKFPKELLHMEEDDE